MNINTSDLPDPYQSLNEDGVIIDINDEWSKLLNYDREEVIGKYFGDFLSENEKPLFKKHFEYFKKMVQYTMLLSFFVTKTDTTCLVIMMVKLPKMIMINLSLSVYLKTIPYLLIIKVNLKKYLIILLTE